jgi:8-oxo-dGTP pyrophosphatase MutT (NUDIX family)
MYKVFFNESFLIITDKAKINNGLNQSILPLQNMRQLEVWLAEAENSAKPVNMVFTYKAPKLIWKEFKSNFKIIKTAGGLIKNNSNQYLFIFRRGKWDLPKGKIDKGETLEMAAIREVKEETGITEVAIQNDLNVTYHIYRLKGKLVFKETFWYLMHSKGNETLIPQTEEDIEKAVWLSKNEIESILENTYDSIKDVIKISGLQQY